MATFNGNDYTLANFIADDGFGYVDVWDRFWSDVLEEMDARRTELGATKLDVAGDASNVTSTATGPTARKLSAWLADLFDSANKFRLTTGAVVMRRIADGGADPSVNPATWVVLKPDGTFLATSGTSTMGLQEAINYAVANGHPLIVHGGSVKGSYPGGVDAAVIHCTSPIIFPAMQKSYVSIRAATLNFAGSPAGTPWAVTIDSCMMAHVESPGSQIVATGAYAGCLDLNPTSELPQDAAGPVITDSIFLIGTTVPAAGKTCVRLNAGTWGIGSNNIRIMEPNGGATGVQVVVGTGAGAFYGNRVEVLDCHAQTTVGVAVGTGTAGAANTGSNRFDIECDPATGATGVAIYGTKDIYTVSISNNEGTPATGIDLKSSAANNAFTIVKNDATTRVSDASNGSNVGMYGPVRPAFQAILSGDQTVNTATVTKVGFGVTFFAQGGTVSGGTWTPSVVGRALVSAQVTWNSAINDQTMQLKIYKNGAEYKTNISALTTTAQQAISITTIVEVTAITDTFEVYVVFYGGTTLDISSNNKLTYFTGAVL